MTKVLLATRSAGKLRELKPLFASAGIDVMDLRDAGIEESEAEEDLESADSFEENALLKARHFHRVSGMPSIADDSGLEVRALGGRPGVRSKRWSGRADLSGEELDAANNAALQSALRDEEELAARYVCVAAYVDGDREITRRGETTGVMLREPLGEDGFGYDPYFLSDDLNLTFGEASCEAKERVSHRGRAFHDLVSALRAG